jgi:SAM-dependent methyltransferase
MNSKQQRWNNRYREGDTPWDSGLRSRELARVLKDEGITVGRTLELGCGTGTNAFYLAQHGFDVTAVDLSATALEVARTKAKEADRQITFIEADVCSLAWRGEPFDFLFDRGCYHSVRKVDLPGFLETLRKVTRPGTQYLSLVGNANEQSADGPPRLYEHEVRADFGELFDFQFIREIHFEDRGGADGPLGWSCLMTRKPEH